ncbi:MAG: HEPN domain-containing protein [Bacillota bacterium]
MNGREREREARKWLDKARSDLRVAGMAFENAEPEYDLACYLSQQCAEKSLKALLIRLGIRFAYKHDLDYLIRLLPLDDQTLFADIESEWLTDWATTGRYPGDIVAATADDARRALEMAQNVYDRVAESGR